MKVEIRLLCWLFELNCCHSILKCGSIEFSLSHPLESQLLYNNFNKFCHTHNLSRSPIRSMKLPGNLNMGQSSQVKSWDCSKYCSVLESLESQDSGFLCILLIMKYYHCTVSSDRGSSIRDLTAWARDPPDGHQDEDPGGAAPRLPEAHRSAQGESVRQGGALHYAANRRKFSPLAGKQKGTQESPQHHDSVCHPL